MEHRIYFDEDSLAEAVIEPVRRLGATCVTTKEAGRLRAPDPQQLQFASAGGMVIYTANQGHFAKLHRDWLSHGKHHAGIIIWRKAVMDAGTQIRALTRLLDAITPEEFVDRLEYLSGWVVRD